MMKWQNSEQMKPNRLEDAVLNSDLWPPSPRVIGTFPFRLLKMNDIDDAGTMTEQGEDLQSFLFGLDKHGVERC